MRQGQQNRRGRGRNRKSQNPLTRSFESNGPDIKIRGTPSHIAEKYISMARDALSSGNPVLAENHLQHAEHYNRIIMMYREQQTQGDNLNGSGNGRHQHMDGTDAEDITTDEFEDAVPGQEPQPAVVANETEGEETTEQQPERPRRRSNANSGRNAPRRRRSDSSQNGERRAAPAPTGGNQGATQTKQQDEPPPARRGDTFADEDGQPDFLKRPVRRPRRSRVASESETTEDDSGSTSADEN